MLRSRYLRLVLLFSASLCLTNCARGVAEFQLYSQAFSAQHSEGELVLDSAAKAERIVGLRLNSPDRSGVIKSFDPAFAAYYVDTADPPITASIRSSAHALKNYNDALLGLANGEAASALTVKVGQITSNLVSAAAAVQSAGVSPLLAAAGGGDWVAKVTGAVNVALPIFEKVAGLIAQQSFRQQLLLAYPEMRRLLVALREGTPTMFFLMQRSYVDPATRSESRSGLTKAGIDNLEKNRIQLAGWVLLLDKSLDAMDAAANAAISNIPAADLAQLAEVSLELKILAEKIKTQRNR